MSKNLIWWEKTVEYYFVANYTKDAIAPLDGKEEGSYSDAMLHQNGKFLLIEFKINKKTLKKEKDKFISYEEAKEKLAASSKKCHYLIYGEVNREFELKAKEYFSEDLKNIDSILDNGVNFKAFEEYLDELAKYKKANDRGEGVSSSGAGGRAISSVAFVCDVKNKQNERKIIVLSHSDFEKILQQNQTQAQNQYQNQKPKPKTKTNTQPKTMKPLYNV